MDVIKLPRHSSFPSAARALQTPYLHPCPLPCRPLGNFVGLSFLLSSKRVDPPFLSLPKKDNSGRLWERMSSESSDPPAAPPAPTPYVPSARPHGSIELRAAEFALRQPLEMPASEVVAQAKGLGLDLELVDVHRLRDRERQRQAKAKPKENSLMSTEETRPPEAASPPASPPETAGEKRRGRRPGGEETKAGFVRSVPASVSAKEVVELAKERGFEISEGYVYAIRSKVKDKEAGVAKRGRKPKATPAPQASVAKAGPKKRGRPASRPAAEEPSPRKRGGRPPKVAAGVKDVEGQFAKLVLQIGLMRAEQLLGQLRGKLTEMLRK